MITTERESNILKAWNNGNALVTLLKDGTRTVIYNGELNLDYPLNVDIRVSNRCAFGLNPKTGKAICDFCHESATTDGAVSDYDLLFRMLKENSLPAGTELAIGANSIGHELLFFLEACECSDWVCNLTVNQGHTWRDEKELTELIDREIVKGLGISYRSGFAMPPTSLLEYPNTVFHVIAGIDTVDEVLALADKGVRKVLVLGEKDFGFNQGRVNTLSENHVNWYRQVRKLFDKFEVVSFDSLALQQLNVKRFVKDYDTFYQGEHSFYINAIDQTFSPSSRSSEKVNWSETTIKDYFGSLK